MTTTSALLRFQPENLWFYVVKLLRLRWVIFEHGFRRAKPLRKLLTLFLGLLALGISVGAFFLTTALLKFLESPLVLESGVDMGAFVGAIPASIVSAAFLGILLTSLGVLLQALYLANDMDFLLTAPIPVRAVFLSKLLQAILPGFILVVLFGLPVLFGLGTAGGYQIVYFPMVLIVLAFLTLAAAGCASLLVMALVRVLPPKRVAEILAFVGLILFIILSQSGNLTGVKSGSLTPEQISKSSQIVSTFNSVWSPLAWGGRALADLGTGRWPSGIFFLALTLGLCGGLFWFALNTSERLYIMGWTSLQVQPQHKKTARTAERRAESGISISIFLRILAPEVRAILLKDLKVLRRDLRIMSQMIAPLIMGFVFTVMALRSGGVPPAGQDEAASVFAKLWAALGFASLPVSLFVGWALLSELALISFSMEGKSYWMIKTSAISAGKQLAGKFLVAYLPALILSWIFLLGIALLQKVPANTVLFCLPCAALILAGAVGINLALGVRFANLTWTDPRHMTDGIITYLGLIAGVVYLLVSLVLFIAPPVGLPLLGVSQGIGWLVGLLVGGCATLLCTILPLKLVKEQVCRIGEE